MVLGLRGNKKGSASASQTPSPLKLITQNLIPSKTSNLRVSFRRKIYFLLVLVFLLARKFKNNETKRCQFSPQHEAPIPVILMGLGRSGSSVTWDTMARLTGEANVAYEVTGGNMTKSKRFFDSIDPDLGSYWAIDRLCHIQKRVMIQNPHSGIAGFQWKPYNYTIDHIHALGALKEISEHQEPTIRIIYLTRNPIDRRISNQRHKGFIRSNEVPAHCAAGDDKCVQKHAMRSKNITLPTGKALIDHIQKSLAHDMEIRRKMDRAGVDYLHVSYEELFHSDSAAKWMKIFQFLGVGPVESLTIDRVQEMFSMVPTSSHKHEETISNYRTVEETLKGTQYYYLLH